MAGRRWWPTPPGTSQVTEPSHLQTMQWKGLLVIAIVAVVAIAVASRVGFLKNIVFGPAPASS